MAIYVNNCEVWRLVTGGVVLHIRCFISSKGVCDNTISVDSIDSLLYSPLRFCP